MSFDNWIQRAIQNVMAEQYIPMGFQPTLPLLLKKGTRSCVGFYYYEMTMFKDQVELASPKFVILFDRTTQNPVYFEELEAGNVPLGVCSELFDPAYAERQKTYRNRFQELCERTENGSEKEYEEAFEEWIQTNPKLLQKVFRECR